MFARAYLGIMKILLIISLIISPIMLALTFFKMIEWENAFQISVFVLFTLVDVGLLIWKMKEWYKNYKFLMLYILMALVMVLCAAPLIRVRMADAAYAKGRSMIQRGEYTAALEHLDEYAAGDDIAAKGLKILCDAHIVYNDGDITGAYERIMDYDRIMPIAKHPSSEDMFLSTVVTEYEAEMAAQALKEQQEIERQKELERLAYERIAVEGRPYVGMPEALIDETPLGKHSSTFKGKRLGKEYTYYDFVKNKRRYLVLCCMDGEVAVMWDMDQHNLSAYSDWKEGKTSSSAKKTSQTVVSGRTFKSSSISKSSDEDDPFNAADYYDPEDFYDDYYDDFYDYYDAEDYYYEHAD